MIRNFIKIAFRNLSRHKRYSIINIGGLAIGLAACMLILLMVIHEYSFDNFHKKGMDTYFTTAKVKIGGDSIQFMGTNMATAPRIQMANPSVTGYLRLLQYDPNNIVINPAVPSIKAAEPDLLYADSNFFSFFSFRLKEGNPDLALSRPFNIVITETIARKYFGNADPIGKYLRIDSAYTFTVTGVTADPPSNSSITWSMIASLSSKLQMRSAAALTSDNDIDFGNITSYFQLKHGANSTSVESTFKTLMAANLVQKDLPARFILKPLKQLHSQRSSFGLSSRYLSVFLLVAGLILLLAMINYMNLATARASLRAKEVGIRKTNGASRRQIARQFYLESAICTTLAFLVGLLLFVIIRPHFYGLIQLKIDPRFMLQPIVFFTFGGLLLLTALLAGLYPSFILSSFKPILTLYGRFSRQGGSAFRKTLTVIQFTVSVTLIICSTLIAQQLHYFRNAATGVDRSNTILLTLPQPISKHSLAFRGEIAKIPGITNTALSSFALYDAYSMCEAYSQDPKNKITTVFFSVDPNFFSLLNIQWTTPPDQHDMFSKDHKIIINELAIDRLKLPANPVGQIIHLDENSFTVAGVLKNFNYASLHSSISPMLVFVNPQDYAWDHFSAPKLMIKTTANANMPVLIGAIRKLYETYDQTSPFTYTFLDEVYANNYRQEEKLAGILGTFTALTVIIACLGLFGLAAFAASQRIKEIGIRRVLGASIGGLVSLMTRDFLRLVLLSIILAAPIAWYFMHQWLESFPYRIHIGWGVFLLTGLATMFIAALTVSVESIRTALSNPARHLRSE